MDWFVCKTMLGSQTYGDVSRAQAVLRAADYYTDAKVALILTNLYLANDFLGSEAQCDPIDVLSFVIQALLRAIEVFDYPLERIKKGSFSQMLHVAPTS